MLLLSGMAVNSQEAESAPRARQYTRINVPVQNGHGAAAPTGSRAAGLTIVPTYDSSITGDPRAADIMATINTALQTYQGLFSDAVTVTVTFKSVKTGLGASQTKSGDFPYADFRAALLSHATSANDNTALTQVPAGTTNPVNSDPNIQLTTALARALGFTSDSASPGPGETDSIVSLNFSALNISAADNDPKKYSLLATVWHEVDEVLGMGSVLDDNKPTAVRPGDLLRFDATGARSFTTDPKAVAFFSIDGKTQLARFNQDKSGDFGDWYSPGGQTPQVQDAFGTPGDSEVLGLELTVLDVIGWTRTGAGPVGGGPVGPNLPPVISSAAACSPNPASAGVQAAFTVGATDPNSDALSYAWDFGDTTTGTGASTTHSYATPGTYNATVTVSDGRGGSVSSSVSVQVNVAIVTATVVKQKFMLNFRTARDGIDVTLSSDQFVGVTDGTEIKFVIGDVANNKGVILDTGTLTRGKAAGSTGRFTLNLKSGTARFATTNASLQDQLLPYGATNDSTSGTVSIPIYFYFNNTYYGDMLNFSYSAVAGKSGKGK